MNLTDARYIVDDCGEKALRRFRAALGLNDWDINIEWARIRPPMYGEPGCDALGMCSADPSRRRATITLDHDLHESRDELLNTLLHELLHVLHADYELVRRQLLPLLSDRETQIAEHAFDHAAERLVGGLERMLCHGIGLDASKLLTKCRSREQRGAGAST